MATDHYKRLKINKDNFDKLDEQGKKELVEKQFKTLKPEGLAGLLPLRRFKLLKNAKDILKDSKLREIYDSLLEDKSIKPNIKYSELKKDSKILELNQYKPAEEKTDQQPKQSTPPPKPPRLNEQIEQTRKELIMMKKAVEEETKPNTRDLKYEVVKSLENKLSKFITREILNVTDKISDINNKIENSSGKERYNLLNSSFELDKKRSELFKEREELNPKSKQSEKEKANQQLNNKISSETQKVSTVLQRATVNRIEKGGREI